MTLIPEKGATRKIWLHQLRIALVYPNSYSVGMSNLGFQHVYHTLNSSENFLAERFFYEPTVFQGSKSFPQLLSIESSRPLRDFHVIAFSLPFENDYLNISIILKSGSIEPLSRNRSSRDPLIMAGGVSVSMNPEPLANFMDLVYIGEISDADAPDSLFQTLANVVDKFRWNVETFDGFNYTVKVGSKTNENYLLTLTIAGNFPKERTAGKDEKPEDKTKLDKEFADKIKKLEEKLAQEKAFEPWTFLVQGWSVDSLLKERAQLFPEKKDEKKDEAKPDAAKEEPAADDKPDDDKK